MATDEEREVMLRAKANIEYGRTDNADLGFVFGLLDVERERTTRLVATLSYYANSANYNHVGAAVHMNWDVPECAPGPKVYADGGSVAREALKAASVTPKVEPDEHE